MDGIVTLEELTNAICNGPNNRGLDREEAYELALRVLNFFGYSDRILDNVLEQEDRDLFYMLEDNTILTTDREETTLYDGREWRIHYWLFKRDKIEKLAQGGETVKKKETPEQSVYETLTDDMWKRGSSE